MKILLDTHIMVWLATDRLSQKAPKSIGYIEDKSNLLLFSSAVIWEVAVKRSKGREDFIIDPFILYNGLLNAGYEELPITGRHTLLISSLPPIHKDPFDRIMLAQAMSEGIVFLTADKLLTQYPGSVIYTGI
ncbi:MAG: type II toxin-antitoxin system VapC family toxin [Oscillospiraceae bacterium]|nr:type II toxin-antitoxin system VapC family toxin [Oscillospiraceae bacterium]